MISIIVPVYNVAPYLPKCLDSLVNQTYGDIEIICVNDGSTDHSGKILEEYAIKDKRIKIITQENKGLSQARNTGMEHAKGEWMMFVDSDDWIDTDCCESAISIVMENDADVVLWAYMREFKSESLSKLYLSETTIWDKNINHLHRRMIGPINDELTRLDTLDSWGTIWGKLYKTSYIKQNSPICFVSTKQIGSAEDVLFNIAYFGRISKAVFTPKTWYHYRKGNSYTTLYKPDLPEKWENLYEEIAKIISDRPLNEGFTEALNNRISIGIIGLGLNEMFAKVPLKQKYQHIKALLNKDVYRMAISRFPIHNFPIHWKLFFFAARQQHALVVLLMLLTIKKIITR